MYAAVSDVKFLKDLIQFIPLLYSDMYLYSAVLPNFSLTLVMLSFSGIFYYNSYPYFIISGMCLL